MKRKTKDLHDARGRFAGSRSLNLGRKASTAQNANVKSPNSSALEGEGDPDFTFTENFMKVYRGLNQPPKKYGFPPIGTVLDSSEPLGIHWTTNRTAAEFFASALDGSIFGQERHHDYGIVLEAMVHVNDIVQEETPEWGILSESRGVMAHDENEFEAEVTVRPGATVNIVAQYTVGEGRRPGRDRVISHRVDLPKPIVRKV
jgi:hypothetical protein